IGLTEKTIVGLLKKTGDERFVLDLYRRLVHMYSNVVMAMDGSQLEKILEESKHKKGVKFDTELDARDWKTIISSYKKKIKEVTGKDFPDDPWEQLWGGIGAVFRSWDTPRAVSYRKINHIPDTWGTAVNVQSMVFGNMGENSATGVAFTRNPSTGDNHFYGEFLINAQGEDVVAGIRTPQPLNIHQKQDPIDVSLEEAMPEIYKELDAIQNKLETHYTDMLDLEFTIQQGKLWMLQSRVGKRTAAAAVKTAVDMEKEGLISKDIAIMRVSPQQIEQLLHPRIDPLSKVKPIAKGLPASPGAAYGSTVFSADEAVEKASKGEKVILVRTETSADDIHGMNAAQAIFTATGGMTSHAAVVARGMGKPCVAGCGNLKINEAAKQFQVGDKKFKEGDFLTLDGSTGTVYEGKVPTIEPEFSKEFNKLMEWADQFRKLKVRTNADTPQDAVKAREFGAQGIGLCRTEHMFFGEERLPIVREMILSKTEENRRIALKKLLPHQKNDFYGILKAMRGLPVTIRLLDPPLHEFLPHDPDDIKKIAITLNVSETDINNRIESLKEFNPMLGHRGCRLGITYPEIYEMQVEAIFMAACELKKEKIEVFPEVMIPLVGTEREFIFLRNLTVKTADKIIQKMAIKLDYLVGTMIEIPRACIVADKIAETAEFFSFGTNDLTQMTFGYSRDDAGVFLPVYIEKGILPIDPFQALDQEGVGQLVKMGVEKGRATRPDLKIGICGEHGGEPSSVIFCHQIGLNYVSCSPFRVPVARLAAAHAALSDKDDSRILFKL
ncbi:MAG: pyruvate, phosphate dikinase, partial [Candidatus Schekmanbacteria bacterium RBG_13_48_7]